MRYVASYLLAALGGNSSPSAKDIKKILDSVGIEADDDRLNKVISELNGKNIEDVIAQGVGKLASVPAGGAVAVSAAPGSAAPAAGSAPAAAEEKKDDGGSVSLRRRGLQELDKYSGSAPSEPQHFLLAACQLGSRGKRRSGLGQPGLGRVPALLRRLAPTCQHICWSLLLPLTS